MIAAERHDATRHRIDEQGRRGTMRAYLIEEMQFQTEQVPRRDRGQDDGIEGAHAMIVGPCECPQQDAVIVLRRREKWTTRSLRTSCSASTQRAMAAAGRS